jgi:hypothetical protein
MYDYHIYHDSAILPAAIFPFPDLIKIWETPIEINGPVADAKLTETPCKKMLVVVV